MIAPSRHTPAKDFRKLLPMFPVSSPANDDSGIGAIAAYIKSLNIRPYTVRIRIKDSTQISKLPISVTAHSGIKSRFARTRTADYKGIEISAVLVRVVPDLHILRQDFVHLPWGLAVLLGDLLCFPPLGGAVFHAAAVIGLRIVVDEKRKPVNCRKD